MTQKLPLPQLNGDVLDYDVAQSELLNGIAPETGEITVFTNGFIADSTRKVKWTKVGNIVSFSGLVRGGTPNTVAFNLPSAIRPKTAKAFPLTSGSIFVTGVTAVNGDLTLSSGWVHLDSLTYNLDT